MEALTVLERQRLVIQTACDAKKSQRERNQLGQFATPTRLADDVLGHARLLIADNEPIRFLDPAFGTGSFYSALLRAFPPGRIAAAVGYEIDPHYAEPTRELWHDYPLDLTIADFTSQPAPPPTEQFNLLVCNPPYVRHHHMDAEKKERLQASTMAASGMQLGGLSGLYCHFLGLSHAWLAEDGIAAWLLPSEFMDVNYGRQVKEYLLTQVELLRIHRFEPNDLQFADALVSSAVVWFRNRPPAANHMVAFTYGGTHEAPTHARHIPAAALLHEAKWTRFPAAEVRVADHSLRLGDFFKIQRGLATGDNSFFIMTRTQIEHLELPFEVFKPILPGPRYLPSDEVDAEPDGTPKIEKQLFMLDCRLPEVDIKLRYPALWRYLQSGKTAVSGRYLCRSRSPWYSQENRPPPPFVCTYMGRTNLRNGRPFRFILNRSRATAANVYLLLYPKAPLASLMEHDSSVARRIWTYLNEIDPQSLIGQGRVYGGGLHKIEPRELANAPADAIADFFPDKLHALGRLL